jgi:3,4-dihydroxy 2-butanone 4-phosphate synthase/GTP cyclohydrolase II
VFPLRAVEGGVRVRRGHTEASVELARLSGRYPAGVICEILNDDGTMARGASLEQFANRHKLLMVSIAELVEYLEEAESDLPRAVPAAAESPVRVERVVETTLPTRFGRWRTIGFRSNHDLEYVALILGSPNVTMPTPVRVHSECLTGDALGSERCDCGRQLEMAMQLIEREGVGAIVYIRGHEGRGIGLLPKLQAYALQDRGRDTVDANLELGYEADLRDYRGAAAVLQHLGLRRIRLLTNNPRKIETLAGEGIEIVERIPLRVRESADNLCYLSTKRARFGHFLEADMNARVSTG